MAVTATVRAIVARPTARVWVYTAGLYAVGLVLYALFVRPLTQAGYASALPWPLLALGFCVADLKTVNVHFRRERHVYSMTEIPGVVGLFALAPGEYLLALATGTGLALLMERRQSRIRRTFNLGNALVVGELTLLLFHALAATDPSAVPGVPPARDWLAAVIAAAGASVVGTADVAAAIVLSGVARATVRLRTMLEFGIVVAVANTSLALVAVLVLATEPSGLLLLVVPITTLYFAYRAYLSEREKHTRLELLYESSRILQDSPELDASVHAVLDHARQMFLAEIAQIVLFPARPGGHALVTTSLADGEDEVMLPIRPVVEPGLWRRVRDERRAFFLAPEVTEPVAGRVIRQGMVAPLTGESNRLGMLLVANRSSQGTDFAADDLRLLETIAGQVGIALENGQLERSLGELSRLKEELRHQAYHDTLTGLPNRALFAEQVDLRLAQHGEHGSGEPPVVLFLDLDDFKNVNDTLGHGVGDRLLVAVADRIRDCVRDADLAARLGGDEFAVLLEGGAGMGDAVAIAERLVSVLRTPFHVDGTEILVGASVGVAAARPDSLAGDELLRNADVAMYTAKSQGKRRLAVFDPQLHAELVARHQLSAELSRSLGRGELLVHYQPILELATRRMVGVEALVRWRHPTRGFVPPEEFVRLAEENGSIDALGTFVLEEACRQTARWRRLVAPGAPFWVSVNVSPRQLQQPTFALDVETTLHDAGLEPRHLVLEMTETGMFQDVAATISRLSTLRELGVQVAMDDFGTGYSSLSFLRRFPVDILKIARDFVTGEPGTDGTDEQDWAFATAIIALGRSLGLQIVAEGIEEPAQLEHLTRLGCVFGQGYLFARPLAPEAIEAALRQGGLAADGASVSVAATSAA